MKLIDILIENDIKWPKGATGVVQDCDGEVKFYAGEKPIYDCAGVWVRGLPVSETGFTETASDYNTAIVTKQEWENRKMTMFADVEIGDNVWDSRKGWGVIDELGHSSEYPLRVDFGYDYDSYTLDGYHSIEDAHPSLFWDEFEIKAPPKPLPKLEVDTKVVVWHDDGSKYRRHFSHFSEDGVLYAFIGGLTSFSGKDGTTAWNNWVIAK